eukprot:747555-Hanusia_phi.AAC.1
MMIRRSGTDRNRVPGPAAGPGRGRSPGPAASGLGGAAAHRRYRTVGTVRYPSPHSASCGGTRTGVRQSLSARQAARLPPAGSRRGAVRVGLGSGGLDDDRTGLHRAAGQPRSIGSDRTVTAATVLTPGCFEAGRAAFKSCPGCLSPSAKPGKSLTDQQGNRLYSAR